MISKIILCDKLLSMRLIEKMNLILLFGFFVSLLFISRNQIVLADAVSDLSSYCHDKFSYSMLDGSDAEIICLTGDPLKILNDTKIQTQFNKLSADEQLYMRNANKCSSVYQDPKIVKNCEELVSESTGEAKNPFPTSESTRTPSKSAADDIYTKILNPAILALSAAVVLAVVGSIVVAGVQYSTANGNSSAVASAKNRIVISILVLILYTFGFAILQWLIPGGIGS